MADGAPQRLAELWYGVEVSATNSTRRSLPPLGLVSNSYCLTSQLFDRTRCQNRPPIFHNKFDPLLNDTANQAEATVVVTEDEKQVLSSLGVKNVWVIPNIHEEISLSEKVAFDGNLSINCFIQFSILEFTFPISCWTLRNLVSTSVLNLSNFSS